MGKSRYLVGFSLVLYNTAKKDLLLVIDSLKTVKIPYVFYIIDNSSTNALFNILEEIGISDFFYFHNPSNPGFGAAHNMAIEKALDEGVLYHFVINPDVVFNGDVVAEMIDYISQDANIGMMMPQILNFDDTVQNLPKLLPSPYSVLMRKLKKPKFLYEPFINKYELRDVSAGLIYEAPILSGCFTLLNLEVIKNVGFYDDKFFMYFEDWDLSRRVNRRYKTVYFPKVSVYHGYESGANKSKKLFKIFIKSAFHYFNKWGWFFDKERKVINKKTLNQFK